MELSKEQQLSNAIALASKVHKDQFDKGGKPYVLHPLHLMSKLLYDTQLATIAVLHDTVEDSDITLKNLKERGFSSRVICALERLTHMPEHSYEEYIEIVSGNLDSILVKRKDLEHNSDITRLKGITQKDLDRMEKYHKAFLKLEQAKAMFNRR